MTLANRSDFYDERYPLASLVPAVATEAFTIVGTGLRPGPLMSDRSFTPS